MADRIATKAELAATMTMLALKVRQLRLARDGGSSVDSHELNGYLKAGEMAAKFYALGVPVVSPLDGEWFVPSRTAADVTHLTSERNCTCEGGRFGACWHRTFVAALNETIRQLEQVSKAGLSSAERKRILRGDEAALV